MARCEACWWCKQRLDEDGRLMAECVKGHALTAVGNPVTLLVPTFTSETSLLLRKHRCKDFSSMNDKGGDWSPGIAEAREDNRRRKQEWNKKRREAKGKEAADAGQVSESA